jgi:hypothetical protein
MIIDPRGLTATEWCDYMADELTVLPMKIARDEDWRDWARHVIQDPSIARHNPPNPEFFEDWQEWAFRFNESVPLEG